MTTLPSELLSYLLQVAPLTVRGLVLFLSLSKKTHNEWIKLLPEVHVDNVPISKVAFLFTPWPLQGSLVWPRRLKVSGQLIVDDPIWGWEELDYQDLTVKITEVIDFYPGETYNGTELGDKHKLFRKAILDETKRLTLLLADGSEMARVIESYVSVDCRFLSRQHGVVTTFLLGEFNEFYRQAKKEMKVFIKGTSRYVDRVIAPHIWVENRAAFKRLSVELRRTIKTLRSSEPLTLKPADIRAMSNLETIEANVQC